VHIFLTTWAALGRSNLQDSIIGMPGLPSPSKQQQKRISHIIQTTMVAISDADNNQSQKQWFG
jgi:hypothetical protein